MSLKHVVKEPHAKALIILGQDGTRIYAKYFDDALAKVQRIFEKKLYENAVGIRATMEAEIMLVDNSVCVFRASENELILSGALNTFVDALGILTECMEIRMRDVIDRMDTVMLCADEIFQRGAIIELDAEVVARRVRMLDKSKGNAGEVTIEQAMSSAREQMRGNLASLIGGRGSSGGGNHNYGGQY